MVGDKPQDECSSQSSSPNFMGMMDSINSVWTMRGQSRVPNSKHNWFLNSEKAQTNLKNAITKTQTESWCNCTEIRAWFGRVPKQWVRTNFQANENLHKKSTKVICTAVISRISIEKMIFWRIFLGHALQLDHRNKHSYFKKIPSMTH